MPVPSQRPALRDISIAIRRGVDERLRVNGRTWQWLADRMVARGLSHEQSVWAWKSGRSVSISAALYVGILEELAADEAQQRREGSR